MAAPSIPSHGDHLGVALLALSAIFIPTCSVLVGMRLWARRLRRDKLSISDYFVILGLFFTCAMTASEMTGVIVGGEGQHTQSVTKSEIIISNQVFTASAYLWTTATVMIKISILLLYIEVFASRGFRMVAYAGVAFVSFFWIGFFISICVQCRPFEKNWNQEIPGHCVNLSAETIGGACINMVIDLALVVLPTPVIWRLHMTLKKKVVVNLLFSLGLVVVGLNCARIAVTKNPAQTDYTFNSAYEGILSLMEVWLGTVIACVPTLRPAASSLGSTASKIFSYKSSQQNLKELDPESAQKPTPDRGHDGRDFHRLQDDDVPLQSMPISNGSTAKYLGRAHLNDSEEQADKINVRRELDVFETRFSSTPQAYESV